MAIYIGTIEGSMQVEGAIISGPPIHIICQSHNVLGSKRSVNFPVNPSFLEVIDSFFPHESHPGASSNTYKGILRDIFCGQKTPDPILVLFDLRKPLLDRSLDTECSSSMVCVARSSEKYVLDHLNMFGKDFSQEF